MEPLGERLFAALPRARHYAVLDGAADRRVRAWTIDTHAATWSLYRGSVPAALDEVAPRLLALDPKARYTAEFFARYWGRSCGILLSSNAPSRDVRRHLRKCLLARVDDGRIVLFRYYDPRVLRVYLPTCTPDETSIFFGPIEAMAAEDERPQSFVVFRKEGAPEWR
jgi:hypothetical protein